MLLLETVGVEDTTSPFELVVTDDVVELAERNCPPLLLSAEKFAVALVVVVVVVPSVF